MNHYQKLARILRTTEADLQKLDQVMSGVSNKSDAVKNMVSENEIKVREAIKNLALGDGQLKADRIYAALIEKLKDSDRKLWELFHRPSGQTKEGLNTLLNFAMEFAKPAPLFVLKKEKAVAMLRDNPPPMTMKALGYKNIDELLEKENFLEVMSALRFVETTEWMHDNFEKNYSALKPDDFEEREVEVLVLAGKWLEIAEKFVAKKYHNVSHLKELGVVFVIPLKIDTAGETMRLFGLILHYLYEVQFYSSLVKRYARIENFSDRFKSLLRGDVNEISLPPAGSVQWLIVQRYLAKDNPDDPRLTAPHVNSEAIHWKKAQNALWRFADKFSELGLSFWRDLDSVGDFFESDSQKGAGTLISFDLIDNIMALVQEKHMIKYLYHQEESMWNKLFASYFSDEQMEQMIVDNFDSGVITFKN